MRIDRKYSDTALFASALKIVRALSERGFPAYFVGGSVRDMLLGAEIKDIDIVSPARPEEVFAIFPRCHAIGASFGIMTVIEDDIPFEVAAFREERAYMDGRHPDEIRYADNPELDAARRDFTVNGLFYDPLNSEILDYVGGRKDLEAGILRTIGNAEERFSEDYLRILRAVRFANRFSFEYDGQLLQAIKALKSKVKMLSAERIRDEFNKMLTGKRPERALKDLFDFGLLNEILPEVAALYGVPQPVKHHPEGDVFNHVMLMLEHMSKPSVELAWSILMHDIAKPSTLSLGEDGTEHFYGHERDGAELTVPIMERLKFPRTVIEAVSEAVKNHMRFAHVHEMRASKWKRLMADANFPLELELHRIDCVSSHKKLQNYVLLLDRAGELAGAPAVPEPLIGGRDLLGMGFRPGPQMGKILREISDMQLNGELKSRDEALAFASKQCLSRD
ncbi:MAG: hypothetical protein A2017_08160 [Lentisphaerae bacterium GWF2_44_16]|nr:MAG: hypothetical protein A2017_08160 [Lentisphaerae bacterium GWF2_44_16]